MKAVHEDLIRQRAYEIWEASGRPLGLDKEHWEQGERELLDAAPEIDAKAPAASATRSPRPDDTDAERHVGQDPVGKPAPGRPPAQGEAARVR